MQGAEITDKTGLILEGGAMRAGFVAGALMAFLDKGLPRFDTAVAVSASIPTLAYFMAGQREEIEQVWRTELPSPRLVCYRNIPAASLMLSRKRPVLDIDYLVYEVVRERYPLKVHRMLRTGTECRFAVTRASDGGLVFLKPEDHDIYDILRAALAVPGAYPGAVRVGVHEYVDGGTVDPLPAKALVESGVRKVVAVLSTPVGCENEPPNFLERTLLWRYFQRYEWLMERLWDAAHTYNEEVAFLGGLAKGPRPRAFIIAPPRMPPARFITRDAGKINRTVDMGYARVAETEAAIRTFLNGTGP